MGSAQSFRSTQRQPRTVVLGELPRVEGSFGTLPAGFASGLDADLDQNVLGGPVLSTVVGRHSQLVHALLAVAQLLCVLDEA